jgi:hypothetical protein
VLDLGRGSQPAPRLVSCPTASAGIKRPGGTRARKPLVKHCAARHPVAIHAAVHRATNAPAPDIHWANIAMSVGGLATAGALLVSLLLLRQQMRNQRQAQQDRHRDHASNISFWITLANAEPDIDQVYGSDEPVVKAGVHIVNASTRPAMSVLVLAGIRGDIWSDASAQDGSMHEEVSAQWDAVAIAPQDTRVFTLEMAVPKSVARIVADYKDAALIGELFFSDAAGVSWVRTHAGDLIERRSAEWINSIPLSLTERDERRRNHPGLRTDAQRNLPVGLVDLVLGSEGSLIETRARRLRTYRRSGSQSPWMSTSQIVTLAADGRRPRRGRSFRPDLAEMSVRLNDLGCVEVPS